MIDVVHLTPLGPQLYEKYFIITNQYKYEVHDCGSLQLCLLYF